MASDSPDGLVGGASTAACLHPLRLVQVDNAEPTPLDSSRG